jgi:hypothetical protein
MILRYRDAYKSIAELSEPELRLAGLRINPKTNIGSRTTYYNNLKIQAKNSDQARQVSGLPEQPRLANFALSPDQNLLAMTHTQPEGVELWLVSLEDAKAMQLTGPSINANMRDVINWFKDSKSMLVKMLPEDRGALIDQSESVPAGPTISTNDGKKAQNRTYQDLLKNPDDEYNFEQLARASLVRVTIDGSENTGWRLICIPILVSPRMETT